MRGALSGMVAVAIVGTLTLLIPPSKHGLVRAVHAQSGCSDATLFGNYRFLYRGDDAPDHSGKRLNNVPQAAVGILNFDGAGGVSLSYTVVSDGVPSRTKFPDTGSYTLHSHCAGTLTDTTADLHFDIVSSSEGTEILGIQTDGAVTDTFEAKKQ
jgi:hypothetical protein